jgi:hypothetical protein
VRSSEKKLIAANCQFEKPLEKRFICEPSSVFEGHAWQPSAKAERSVRPRVHSIVLRFIIYPAGMLPGEKNWAAFARFLLRWSDEQTSSGSFLRPPVSH